jgi:low temperature requirement protein LtrA
MTLRRASRGRVSRLSTELRERETVKPLELYFDLVFVLGFTQCTALMATQRARSWLGVSPALRARSWPFRGRRMALCWAAIEWRAA